MQTVSVYGAQASDKFVPNGVSNQLMKVVSPSKLPDYVEEVWHEDDRFRFHEYLTLNSLTNHLNDFEQECRQPLWVHIGFSRWITSSSGIDVNYRLPIIGNTVQFVTEPTIDRWLRVRSMSRPALTAYCDWMQQETNTLVFGVTESQKNKILRAYKKRIQSCLQELEEQQEKLREDEYRTQFAQDNTCRTMRNLTLGVTTVTALMTALLSHFECSKLTYVTGGLYASYVWWQWFEHQESVRQCKVEKQRTQLKLEQNERVSAQLKNSIELQEKIDSLFGNMSYDSMIHAERKIQNYRRQEERKLVDWQRGQAFFLKTEVIGRNRVQEDEILIRQQKTENFMQEQSRLMQQHSELLLREQDAQLIQPVQEIARAYHPKGWKDAGKAMLGSLISPFLRKKL